MRQFSWLVSVLVAVAASGATPEETNKLTSLTPEEAEKLICTDTTSRTVENTRRVTITKCRPEQRTRTYTVDGQTKEATYTVMVPFTEQVTQKYTVAICGGDQLSLNGITELSAETAKVLARHKGSLQLDGLKELVPELAEPLATCTANLSLRGVSTLTPEAAKLLAKRKANTDLSGLKDLDSNVATSLSACSSGWLILNGLTELTPEIARSLAACSANLGLQGLTSLTPETAGILAKHKGNTGLAGLKELSPEVAKSLSTSSSEGLCLSGLETLAPDIAEDLAQCSCYLSLSGLRELPSESAKRLSAYRGRGLYLDGIKQISLDDAKSLASCSGSLSLGGLETVAADVADALCDRSGTLSLMGLKRVDACTYEMLRLKAALPYEVTVANANSRVVVWKEKQQTPMTELQQTLSEGMGLPVKIDKEVIDIVGGSLQEASATPPSRVMDASQAVSWLAQELGRGSLGAVVPVISDRAVRFQVGRAVKQGATESAADTAPPAEKKHAPSREPSATKEPVIDANALRKAFGALRATYDKKTGVLTLAYDFGRPDQFRDWEAKGDPPARVNGDKVIRVGAAQSLVHRAVLKEGKCTFNYSLGDVPDKGMVITAGKVATVTQSQMNRRRYFTLNGVEPFIDPRDKHASVEDASVLQFNVGLFVGAERCVLTVNGAETAASRQDDGAFRFALNGGDNGGAFSSVTITGKPDPGWLMNALGNQDSK